MRPPAADPPEPSAPRATGQVRRRADGRWRFGPVLPPGDDPARSEVPGLPIHDGPVETGAIVCRLAIAAPGEIHGAADGYAVVVGDSGHPARQLVEELQPLVQEGPVLIAGTEPPRDVMVARLGLLDGMVVGPARPALPAPPPAGLVLRVVGGPDAGRTWSAAARTIDIGSSTGAGIRLQDAAVRPTHAILSHTGEGIVIADTTGGADPPRLEGEPVDQAVMRLGDVVRIGASLLELGRAEDAETVTLERRRDVLALNRRFRAGVEPPPGHLRRPHAPDPGQPPSLNLVVALLPAAGFVAMAAIFGRVEMLAFAAISPLLVVARGVSARRAHAKRSRLQAQTFERDGVRFRESLARLAAAERQHRRALRPDMARIVEAALRPTTLLWSHRARDDDALTLRVGAANAPSLLEIDGDGEGGQAGTDGVPDQPWLPVEVSLSTLGGLALTGELRQLRPLAAAMVLQAVVLHAPSELELVFLAGADAEPAWRWLRWLPHLRRGRLEPSLAMGTDPTSRAIWIEQLRRLVARRRDQAGARPTAFTPRVLLVVDDASARMAEGLADVLRDGPEVGVHALTLDQVQVPEGCDAVLAVPADPSAARLERRGASAVRDIVGDGIDPSLAETVGRRLAPLATVGDIDQQGLPATSRLLDVLDVAATSAHVLARWAASSPTPRVTIGVGTERAVSLDLTRDGPHALVAGTTGSGKSEFIKTLVASLALVNHPDHLALLMIDFKGGGDYQLLKQLPHTVSLATHLDDPAAFERTLQLLDAEMARRVSVLQRAGTPSIDAYFATPGGPPEPLPRLLVVVDEFAELKDRAPAQLDRLVSVARTGRAVGVHLLLATQRPGGVVTSQIDANVGLRVCFRVTDEQESREILDSPLAGRIDEAHRGRCFLRSAATPLTEVQTARVGGPRPGAVSAPPIRVLQLGWEALGRPLPMRTDAGEVPDADTDLWDVVTAVREAARSHGWTGNAIPWPPELPDQLTIGQLALPTDAPDSWVPIGVVDVPEAQRREVAWIKLGAGHVVFAGSARTGRSTALRTFLAGLVRRLGPRDVRIAALDFGGGALQPVQRLPHTLGLALEDLDGAEQVVEALERELAARREAFADAGWPDLAAQREQSATPLPWLVLVIDGWDNLAEAGVRRQLPGRIAQLLARGTPHGLQVVLAGDRGTTSSMVARHLTHRYSLRFNRVVDAELQGLLARHIPQHQPPGRAVEVDSRHLVQVAELDDPRGVGQAVAFQQALAEAAPSDPARPDDAGHGEDSAAEALLTETPPPTVALPLLLGRRADDRAPVWADAAASDHVFFVAGPAGTGRSSALRLMALAAHATGDTDVVVIGPDDSPLLTRPPVAARRAHLADDPRSLLPENGRRLLVLVDDLDRLDDDRAAQRSLGETVAGRAVVVAADLDWLKLRFSGLAAAVRRPRIGLLLSPASTSNGVELFSRSLDRAMIKPVAPGRGVANLGDGPFEVQVPPSD